MKHSTFAQLVIGFVTIPLISIVSKRKIVPFVYTIVEVLSGSVACWTSSYVFEIKELIMSKFTYLGHADFRKWTNKKVPSSLGDWTISDSAFIITYSSLLVKNANEHCWLKLESETVLSFLMPNPFILHKSLSKGLLVVF